MASYLTSEWTEQLMSEATERLREKGVATFTLNTNIGRKIKRIWKTATDTKELSPTERNNLDRLVKFLTDNDLTFEKLEENSKAITEKNRAKRKANGEPQQRNHFREHRPFAPSKDEAFYTDLVLKFGKDRILPIVKQIHDVFQQTGEIPETMNLGSHTVHPHQVVAVLKRLVGDKTIDDSFRPLPGAFADYLERRLHNSRRAQPSSEALALSFKPSSAQRRSRR